MAARRPRTLQAARRCPNILPLRVWPAQNRKRARPNAAQFVRFLRQRARPCPCSRRPVTLPSTKDARNKTMLAGLLNDAMNLQWTSGWPPPLSNRNAIKPPTDHSGKHLQSAANATDLSPSISQHAVELLLEDIRLQRPILGRYPPIIGCRCSRRKTLRQGRFLKLKKGAVPGAPHLFQIRHAGPESLAIAQGRPAAHAGCCPARLLQRCCPCQESQLIKPLFHVPLGNLQRGRADRRIAGQETSSRHVPHVRTAVLLVRVLNF